MWKYNETDNLPGNSLYHSADELYHYGVLGMKWKHHKARLNEYDKRYETDTNKILSKTSNMKQAQKKINSLERKLNKEYKDSIDYKMKRDKRIKTAKIIGGSAAIAAGAYAVHKYLKKNNVKFTTERRLKAQQWAAESKRLDNLIANSNKNFDSFTKNFVNKSTLDKIPVSKTSVTDAELRRKMYNVAFGK